MGKPSDLNVGNGKSVSIVGEVINQYLENENKQIFSNISLKGVDYTPFSPENIKDVLNTNNALVILDELHAIVHKNHKISETCKRHSVPGLCYKISEFLRQVRKRGIDTYSSCQTFQDAHFQYRTLMQRQVVCEKFSLFNGKLSKCNSDKCPEDHRHYIKQTLYQNFNYVKELPLFDPEPFYDFYDSFEIVEGWVSYE